MRKSLLFVVVLVVGLVAGTIVSAALLTNYTELPAKFQVQKSIVVEGEYYLNKSYALELNLGVLYQGENKTETINITNRASVNLTVELVCDEVVLVYKSGYTLKKSPENASQEWGINITTPGGITIPAKSTISAEINVRIAVNAQIASDEDEKYDHYEARMYVRAVV